MIALSTRVYAAEGGMKIEKQLCVFVGFLICLLFIGGLAVASWKLLYSSPPLLRILLSGVIGVIAGFVIVLFLNHLHIRLISAPQLFVPPVTSAVATFSLLGGIIGTVTGVVALLVALAVEAVTGLGYQIVSSGEIFLYWVVILVAAGACWGLIIDTSDPTAHQVGQSEW